jgi:hypothetical protein
MFTRLPSLRSERWSLVKEFIGGWYGQLTENDRITEAELLESEAALGFKFPVALREWYLLAGRRKDIWSQQDSLYVPKTIAELRGKTEACYDRFQTDLVFYAENQGCEFWVVKEEQLRLDDPPVWRTVDDPRQVTSSVTEFAIQTLLRESIWAGSYRAWGEFEPSVFDEALANLSKHFRACDLSDRFWETLEPIRFYEATDAIMVTHANSWIYLSALNQAACDQIPVNLRSQLEWDRPRS